MTNFTKELKSAPPARMSLIKLLRPAAIEKRDAGKVDNNDATALIKQLHRTGGRPLVKGLL